MEKIGAVLGAIIFIWVVAAVGSWMLTVAAVFITVSVIWALITGIEE